MTPRVNQIDRWTEMAESLDPAETISTFLANAGDERAARLRRKG